MSTYFADHEDDTEIARLTLQDRHYTEAMGGVLAEQPEPDVARLADVLDLGCGPGGWAVALAAGYPGKRVHGVDISVKMIDHARRAAARRHLDNAEFSVMDLTAPLEFSDGAFDLVNARQIGFLAPPAWRRLLGECVRVLRPAGIVRLTEVEAPLTSSAGLERCFLFFTRALHARGQSFSPTGHRLGLVPMLKPLLSGAGLVGVSHRGHFVDCSAATPLRDDFASKWLDLFALMRGFILETGVAEPGEYADAYERMRAELAADDFACVAQLFTAWGRRS